MKPKGIKIDPKEQKKNLKITQNSHKQLKNYHKETLQPNIKWSPQSHTIKKLTQNGLKETKKNKKQNDEKKMHDNKKMYTKWPKTNKK